MTVVCSYVIVNVWVKREIKNYNFIHFGSNLLDIFLYRWYLAIVRSDRITRQLLEIQNKTKDLPHHQHLCLSEQVCTRPTKENEKCNYSKTSFHDVWGHHLQIVSDLCHITVVKYTDYGKNGTIQYGIVVIYILKYYTI